MPTPRADKQAQAAAHRLGKDLAALKQALPPGPAEDRPDIRDIPAVYRAFQKQGSQQSRRACNLNPVELLGILGES
ncbi:hypothetical protein AK812_SmicGene48346 [Symbiodinium microadriaticum]|uniref:Uncharacterized protein n=1 Tax=Symbiodinium microadriaticum TaxID=2951 RepID=A0A1Q9BQ54_SYMMI|nr:hypothetical protein AK812_SmicGene48346 [Symbiodinium microadriaticum]